MFSQLLVSVEHTDSINQFYYKLWEVLESGCERHSPKFAIDFLIVITKREKAG